MNSSKRLLYREHTNQEGFRIGEGSRPIHLYSSSSILPSPLRPLPTEARLRFISKGIWTGSVAGYFLPASLDLLGAVHSFTIGGRCIRRLETIEQRRSAVILGATRYTDEELRDRKKIDPWIQTVLVELRCPGCGHDGRLVGSTIETPPRKDPKRLADCR